MKFRPIKCVRSKRGILGPQVVVLLGLFSSMQVRAKWKCYDAQKFIKFIFSLLFAVSPFPRCTA